MSRATTIFALGLLLTALTGAALADPLPSWRAGVSKAAITDFVEAVTTPGSPDYIDPSERIATFDNDGNLWAEQPVYFQLIYALEKVKEMAAADPGLADGNPAVRAAVDGDLDALIADHHKGLLEIVALSHAGMTTDEFKTSVDAWLETARHPETGRRFDEMIYQPMLELLAYLRENGFKTYIVSGGGIDFIRVFSERAYGIPPEQVVGSSIRSEFKVVDGAGVTVKTPELFFIDDKEGKPVGINHHIGRRPVFASGNSDGDHQMLQYATYGDKPGFALILHHTDSDREWAYDRDSAIGRLDKALAEAGERDWTVIDMKRDWRTVFPFELEVSGE
jgi:phosphoglycolate phosphatase-like HAD superfamily hydrolase